LSFLKKHYEKIILTILLLLFVVALVYQISIVLNARKIRPEDLELPKKKPDYRQIDFTRTEYNIMENLSKDDKWLDPGPRVAGAKFWTDLMVPVECARTIHGRKKIVPLYFFLKKYAVNRCPWTGNELKQPEVPPAPEDMDKDGLPNKLEELAGLDKEKPEDAHYDKDDDGFSNMIEYKFFKNKPVEQQGKAISDPKIHPPLALRLYVSRIIRTKIDIVLKKVRPRGEDKKKWEIHLEVKTARGWRSRFPFLGGTVKIDGEKYKIIDVNYKIKEVFDNTVNATVKKNISEITIAPVGDGEGEKIVVAIGKPTFAPKKKVVIKDSIDDSVYNVIVGQSFVVGNSALGKEKYTLVSADPTSKSAKIKSEDGKEYTITEEMMEKPLSPTAEGERRPDMMPEPGRGGIPGDPAFPELPKDMRRTRR
jgi:hypothetical protein